MALVCWQGDWHLVPTGAEGLPSSLGRKSTGHSTLQTAAPSPRAPPKVAPCPPICASALALREPRQPLTGSERVPEHRAAPTQGTARGPLAPDQDLSTQSRQELPSQKCHQQGRVHPTSQRQASGTGRRRPPWQRAGPGSPGCRPLPPPPQPRLRSRRLGPEHTSSPVRAPKTGSSPSKVASGQAQGRQASLAALMGTPAPSASPSHPQASASDNPTPP